MEVEAGERAEKKTVAAERVNINAAGGIRDGEMKGEEGGH